MAHRHVMTSARRAALKKAQLASARKRARGGGAKARSFYQRHRRGINIAAGVGTVGAIGAGIALGMSGHKSTAVHGTKIKPGVTRGSVGPYSGRIPGYGTGPRGYPSHISLGTGGTSWNQDKDPSIRYQHRPRPPRSMKMGRANPNEDIVAAHRLKKKVIGQVHTSKGATPHVHLGPVSYKPIKTGIFAGEVRPVRHYGR